MKTPTLLETTLSPNLKTGILHLGFGAFHRAHQAPLTQTAVERAGGDWGIEAVSMRNCALARDLNRQDGHYTLIERHPDGPRFRDMRIVRNALCLADDPKAVVERFADPDLHIVTITVTEKGYGADLSARRLDKQNAVVAHDIARPNAPTGLIGLLVAGLSRRKNDGKDGLSILSCDNLPDNGHLLRTLVLEFATETEPQLVAWIEDTCTFPCSMVDRITPASSKDTIALAEKIRGHPDPVAVETEPFCQWVIENRFAGSRPAWEQAGVLIVDDVAPFETMKLRMLNGAHSLIAYLGMAFSLDMVRDVMAGPQLAALVRRHMQDAALTLTPHPQLDPSNYADDLILRFENRAIAHRCAQIAMDGSQKLPQRIFAPAKVLLDRGCAIPTFALTTALWLHHIERGQVVSDPLAAKLNDLVNVPASDARELVVRVGALPELADQGLFAMDIWVDQVAARLDGLRRLGPTSLDDLIG